MMRFFRTPNTSQPSGTGPKMSPSNNINTSGSSGRSLSVSNLAVPVTLDVRDSTPLQPDGDVDEIARGIRILLQQRRMHIGEEQKTEQTLRSCSPRPSGRRFQELLHRVVEGFVDSITSLSRRCIRLVLVLWTTSPTRPTSEVATNLALRELCMKLLEHARLGSALARIAAMKEIIALVIEDPAARTVLRECQQDFHLSSTTTSSNPELNSWTSRALFALDDVHVYDLWSKMMAEPAKMDELQALSQNRITNTDGQLTELSKTLKDPQSSYLAARYLERAIIIAQGRLSGPDRHSTDTTEVHVEPPSLHPSPVPTRSTTPIAEHESRSEFPEIPVSSPALTESLDDDVISVPQQGQQKPKTSKELLKYVLESAPEGSLRDLTKTVHVDTKNDRVIGRGGFSDVYEGSMPISGNSVVIKLFRLHCEGLDGVKNFAKELRVSSRLRHPNILTPLGYVLREGEGSEEYYIVSEYMQRGSLRYCMPDLSMRERFNMSLGIAEGIRYLHDNDVVHGDIKADNVLLSSSGVPLLTDFGLSRARESFVSKGYYSTETPRGSMRWLAYEYFDNDDSQVFRLNIKTDVWAFGMTLLELLTGDVPFAHIRSDSRVVTEIVMGRLPKKPTVDTNDGDGDLKLFMWSICLKCWTKELDERPTIHVILKEMALH